MTEPVDLQLPPNGASNLAGLNRRIAADRNVVVIFAGPRDSGKTTLLVELWSKFLSGPVGDFAFAGSQTLLGFEQRAFLSRVRSMRSTADTERTTLAPGEAASFLHLRLRRMTDGTVRGLLLSDWPGEVFRQLKDNTEPAHLSELEQSPRLGVVVDGAELSDSAGRHAARANTEELLSALGQHPNLRRDLPLALVITKWDRVVARGARAVSYAETLTADMATKFGTRFPNLTHIVTAARSEDDATPSGKGLLKLLEWAMSDQLPGESGSPSRSGRSFLDFHTSDSALPALMRKRASR